MPDMEADRVTLGEAEELQLTMSDVEGEPLGKGGRVGDDVTMLLWEGTPDPVPPNDPVLYWVEEGQWDTLGDIDAEWVLEALGDEDRVKWDGVLEGEGEGVAESTPEWVLNRSDPVGPVLPLGEMEGVAEVNAEEDIEVLLDADGVK